MSPVGREALVKATAELFLRQGTRVAIWDIDKKAGKSVVDIWQTEGLDCQFYRVDTRNLKETEATAAQVVNDFGRIDILVNNAGITRDASMKKMTTG